MVRLLMFGQTTIGLPQSTSAMLMGRPTHPGHTIGFRMMGRIARLASPSIQPLLHLARGVLAQLQDSLPV